MRYKPFCRNYTFCKFIYTAVLKTGANCYSLLSFNCHFSNSRRQRRRVVERSEPFYYRWLLVISIAVLYNWYIIIARSCFPELQTEYYVWWYVLDYLFDVIYVCDMGVQLRTGKKQHNANRLNALFN